MLQLAVTEGSKQRQTNALLLRARDSISVCTCNLEAFVSPRLAVLEHSAAQLDRTPACECRVGSGTSRPLVSAAVRGGEKEKDVSV